MEFSFAILVGLLLAIFALLIYVFFFRRPVKVADDKSLLLMQQQIQDLRRTLESGLAESNNNAHKQYRDSRSLIQEINRDINAQIKDMVRGVEQATESSKQVLGVADQLKQLQDILKNPKQRGVLGEYYLEAVLQNVLPPGKFQMQYAFENGEIVDAAIFVKDKVIPVDSKFSLENYNRYIETSDPVEKALLKKTFVNDLKLRIQETAKYIRPSEKTMDFAFMFIPSEGIYYELLSNSIGDGEDNLIHRSVGKFKVIIVSPTSLLAYLQTVLQGLKALEIEEKALDIIKNVEKLGVHIGKYEDFYKKLGGTLATTVGHYNAGYKELSKIDKDVTRITGTTIAVETLSLDKPQNGEEH